MSLSISIVLPAQSICWLDCRKHGLCASIALSSIEMKPNFLLHVVKSGARICTLAKSKSCTPSHLVDLPPSPNTKIQHIPVAVSHSFWSVSIPNYDTVKTHFCGKIKKWGWVGLKAVPQPAAAPDLWWLHCLEMMHWLLQSVICCMSSATDISNLV